MDRKMSGNIGREALVGFAQELNSKMKRGVSIFEEEPLKLIRSFPKPIAVDWSYVLFDEQSWVPNPETREALEIMRSVGTVCIVTTYREWEELYKGFVKEGLCDQGMVLMTSANYETYGHSRRRADKVISDFVKTTIALGAQYPQLVEEEFKWGTAYKRLAPIFGKKFKVPMIDDSPYVVDRYGSTPDVTPMINWGMYTLWVKPFYSDLARKPEFDDRGRRVLEGKLTLLEAAEKVREYYTNLSL